MKLWMLGNRLTTELYERERFNEEADKYGIDFTVVFADEIDLIVSRDDRKSIRFRNDIVPLPDGVLARTGSGTGYFNLSVLRQFERLNVLTLPNSIQLRHQRISYMQVKSWLKQDFLFLKRCLQDFLVKQKLLRNK